MNLERNICANIKYIGQDDCECRLFESQYATPEGMCYNSYVVLDEKIAVMDTSDKDTIGGWIADLRKTLNGREPSYLVVHHIEPDHTAGLDGMLKAFPSIQIVCSAKAAQMLPLYFSHDFSGRVITVKDGDTLSLGSHELRFIMAPMVHWPEVMMTYDLTDKVLFSADAFGKFGVYDASPDDWACEARRYYFNVCGKYGQMVQNVLKKVSGLEIVRILPLHGPILEGDRLEEALRLYEIWSSYKVETDGVFIAHASIHGCTKEAAETLAEILKENGCAKVAINDLTRDDQAEAVEDAFRYGKMVLAASSYDAGLFAPMQEFLSRLQSKNYQKRTVALIENGSWAPSAGRVMGEMVAKMKDVAVLDGMLTLRGRMKESDIESLKHLAAEILKK